MLQSFANMKAPILIKQVQLEASLYSCPSNNKRECICK